MLGIVDTTFQVTDVTIIWGLLRRNCDVEVETTGRSQISIGVHQRLRSGMYSCL